MFHNNLPISPSLSLFLTLGKMIKGLEIDGSKQNVSVPGAIIVPVFRMVNHIMCLLIFEIH